MTIENLYPSQRPDIIYNPLNGPHGLPAASNFSRASQRTYLRSDGWIGVAAVDEPAVGYDVETMQFKGLILGQETENLVQWSTDPQAFSTASPSTWNPLAATFGVLDPMNRNNAVEIEVDFNSYVRWRDTVKPINIVKDKIYWVSIFVKAVSGGSDTITIQVDENNFSGPRHTFSYTFSTNTFTETSATAQAEDLSVQEYNDGWIRLGVKIKANPANAGSSAKWILMSRPKAVGDPAEKYAYFGWQITQGEKLFDYIPVYNGDTVAAAAAEDVLSLDVTNNFDSGWSILLDSEAEPGAAVYKVKSNGSEIASLANDAGTLKWEIDGVSAQSNGSYPQIGFPSGRVKTVSGFGPSGQGSVDNFLYTTGIQFPTAATPASGADEIELLGPQTVKALYVWEGQLDEVKAVSLIKGQYRLVTNAPIAADSYSFVYDSDPTSTANANVSLPYISPTVSMTVDWGDVSSDAYEQGVVPSHSYTYPGKYRIQIDADDGLDSTRLADVDDSIIRVDQWAPQHRPGAAGDGFAGADLIQFFELQGALEFIPPFKYTNLTSLEKAFYGCDVLEVNSFGWVPYELPVCTSLSDAFNGVSTNASDQTPQNLAAFPQLETSSSLLDVYQVFANTAITGFVDSNGTPTEQPFTNSSQVTGWTRAFANTSLTSLNVDTSSALALFGTFSNGAWIQSPVFNSPLCTDFQGLFHECSLMVEMHPSIASSSFASGINFRFAWRNCSSLASFPLIDTSSGTVFNKTWDGCGSLNNIGVVAGATTSFPLIDTSSGVDFSYAWLYCAAMTVFPLIDTSNGTNFVGAWNGCNSLTSFPLLDTSSGTDFRNTWVNCQSLTSFPLINVANGEDFQGAWKLCIGLTQFPALNFSKGRDFGGAWELCSSLSTFPAGVFDTTGVLAGDGFGAAFSGCALDITSIENILVSLDVNGQSNIELGLDGGTNAPKTSWTANANAAYTSLTSKGWTISHN